MGIDFEKKNSTQYFLSNQQGWWKISISKHIQTVETNNVFSPVVTMRNGGAVERVGFDEVGTSFKISLM